ncbi:hypothetical protein ACSBPQ_04775 [Stenotrophomonas sp. JC08]|uniref:hypothetical protein n=1 Tax=Stenotrophomonas sp. JC08 TaxID=3445779 RepID=UPI003FA248A3
MASFLRAAGIALSLATVALLAGCASSGKPVAKAEEKPITVTVEAPAAEKDALGNYRFLMQQGETRMSADQFDAWMKANGIRVAKGAPAAVPEAAKPAKPGKN